MNIINDRNIYILWVSNIRGKGSFVGHVAPQMHFLFSGFSFFFVKCSYARATLATAIALTRSFLNILILILTLAHIYVHILWNHYTYYISSKNSVRKWYNDYYTYYPYWYSILYSIFCKDIIIIYYTIFLLVIIFM